ncbi:MAG: FAD-dependent oxidoreductase [Planctomycetes bacterium]|nr:FAD-dependent oxidoreductase [Planctomycetota bacterium]
MKSNSMKDVVEINVTKAELISGIQKMMQAKMRFTTATCIDRKDQTEIIYHFADESSKLSNVRLLTKKGEVIPSISQIYLAATLIENEIHDQFGVEFTGNALDYEQKFLITGDSPRLTLNKLTTDIGICTVQKKARCHDACPAGINVPNYVRLISDGKYKEALEVIYQNNPLPAICGRVCFAPCEINCRQTIQDEAVMIRLLKRFVSDKVGIGIPKPNAPKTGKKVAIIGSGPGGLVAGFYLARKGHSVTIFEALPEPGGYMRVGIPEYRLPRDILAKEIKIIQDQGVEIKTNTRIDNVDTLFQQGFNAVLVATGAHKNMPLGVPGEEVEGVLNCVKFLREVNLGQKVNLGSKVFVVGGGNSAIDAARVALRAGAKEVTMLYRRTQKEMPATPKEIHEALEEGVKLEALCAPTKISRANNKLQITNIRMKLGAPDSSGRPRPEPIPGSEFTIEADSLIAAIGQSAELSPQMGITLAKGGKIDKINKNGVFAAGDLVTGPTSVVEAIRTAREAAASIDKFLGGDGVILKETKTGNPEFIKRIDLEDRLKRCKQVGNPCLKADKRSDNFKEVECGLTEDMALTEAMRCWRCNWTEC